jgi:tRNA 2-selenouridine synthase
MLQAELDARARFTAVDYAVVASDSNRLAEILQALVPYHGHTVVAEWQALAATGQTVALARALMALHYDPRYRKAETLRAGTCGTVDMGDLTPRAITRAADAVLARFGS